jgi:hypothetical protein
MRRIAIPVASAGFIFSEYPWHRLALPSDEKLPPMESSSTVKQQPPEQRGAYLARIGNCMGCHTAQGGKPCAGVIAWILPSVHSLPQHHARQDTGIGLWNEDDFVRCMKVRGVMALLYIPRFLYGIYKNYA